MKKVLASGLDMLIYPEGSRNRTKDPLKSFYNGAFTLSVETQKEILPVLLFNTKKVLPVHKLFFLAPHRLELHFLPPLSPIDLSATELKNKVFAIMWQYYNAHA